MSATVDCDMSEHESNASEVEERVESPVTTSQAEPPTVTDTLLVIEELIMAPQSTALLEEAIVPVKTSSIPPVRSCSTALLDVTHHRILK